MLKVMAPTYENSRNQTKLMMMTMISNKTHFPKMKTQNNLSRTMSNKNRKSASSQIKMMRMMMIVSNNSFENMRR